MAAAVSRAVFRYRVPIDDHWFPVTMSRVRDVRRVETAGIGAVEFWAEHDETDTQTVRYFRVFGTGHPLPIGAWWVGTAGRTESGLVWHLLETSRPE